jgi:hypothetical protein
LPNDFQILAIRFVTGKPLSANFLRGRFGKALHDLDSATYQRWFAPKADGGPSGLRDSPRAFVFRTSLADGFGLNLFDVTAGAADLAIAAVSKFAAIDDVRCESVRLSLEPVREARRVRVTFLTPTEIKGGVHPRPYGQGCPDFSVLFARLRDRISTLRAVYQGGPLEVDFKAAAARAGKVRMTCCEIQNVRAERTSRNTGQTHPLSGFTGVIEYEGDLTEFLPYLEIGRYTGVGRQTVWGKGEIDAVVA